MHNGQDSATITADRVKASQPYRPQAPISVLRLGPAAKWFTTQWEDQALLIAPTEPLPHRCLIRPAALFQHQAGFPDVNMVMGRLLFPPGQAEPQRYSPFTYDSDRRFRELFLAMEATPDDDLFSSATRWSNAEGIAKRLLAAAGVDWDGLTDTETQQLVGDEPWHQPLEGCVLHALAKWTAARGSCVMEIGSLRGLSTAMLGRALRAAKSPAVLISIDPHVERPLNRSRVALALAEIGEEKRLIQMPCTSDKACRLLRDSQASLIFIDGDHSGRQVLADWKNYRDLLAPGGCLVFHDYGYGPHNGRPDVVADVRPVIDKHVLPDDAFAPLLLAHTMFAFVKRPT